MGRLKVLGLGSGGLRGIYHIAVIQTLSEMNLLSDIKKIYGCSVGALVSVLYIIGYTIDELIHLLTDFSAIDIINVNGSNIIEFPKTWGLDNGRKYDQFIKKLLEKKECSPYMTFLQLYQKYNIHLVITTTNISKHRLDTLDHLSHPDLSLATAIRMSGAVPFIFQPVMYNDDLYVDGVVIGDLPLGIIDDPSETLVINLFSKQQNPTDFRLYISTLIRCVQHECFQYARTHYPKSCIFAELSYDEFMNSDNKTFNISKVMEIITSSKKTLRENIETIITHFDDIQTKNDENIQNNIDIKNDENIE